MKQGPTEQARQRYAEYFCPPVPVSKLGTHIRFSKESNLKLLNPERERTFCALSATLGDEKEAMQFLRIPRD